MVEFIVLALATFRISELITYENGPWDMFLELREFLGAEKDEPDTFFGNLLACVRCNSVWVGTILTLLYLIIPLSVYLAFPFALSAIAVFLSNKLG